MRRNSCDLNLNEERIVQPLREYSNVAMRFYATEDEIQNLCSMSGGDLDSGGFTPYPLTRAKMIVRELRVAANPTSLSGDVTHSFEEFQPQVNDIAFNVFPNFPRISQFENPGLTDRVNRMAQFAQSRAVLDGRTRLGR